MASSDTKSMAKGALTIMLIAGMTKILGFLRVAVMASYFGATAQTDIYTMASKAPSLIYTFLNAIIVATFIPLYTKIEAESSREKADEFASRMMNLMMLITGLLVVVGLVFAPQIMSVLAYDYEGDKMSNTIAMVRIMMPMLLMQMMTIIYCNILNANRRFAGPQFYGMPLSICVILACVFLSDTLGAYALAWGTLASALVQMLLMGFLARKYFHWSPSLSLHDTHVGKAMKLAVPAVLSTSVLEINSTLDAMLSSGLADGHLASLEYANRLISVVVGTVIVAAHTTTYTQLSECASRKDKEGFSHILSRNLAVLIMILLPIMLVAIINAQEIVSVVYERGSFDATATTLTSGILVFYAPYLLFTGIRDVGTRAFYALGNTKAPMISGIISMGTNAVLNLILVRFMGAYGLALATAIAMLAACVVLLIQLRRQAGGLGVRQYGKDYLWMLAGSVICAVLLLLVRWLLPQVHALVRLCACCAAGLSAYAATMYLSGSFIARQLVQGIIANIRSKLKQARS